MNASQAATDQLRRGTRQPDVGERLRAVAARTLATSETSVARARLTPAQRHLSGLERPLPADRLARQLKTFKMFETPKVAFTPPSLESFFSQQRAVLGDPKRNLLLRNAIRDATRPTRDFSGLLASHKAKSVGLLATDHFAGAARPFITPRIADTWRRDLLGLSKPFYALADSSLPGAAVGFMASRSKGLKLLEAHIQGLSSVTGPALAASRLSASLGGLRPEITASLAASLARPNISLIQSHSFASAGQDAALQKALAGLSVGPHTWPKMDYSRFVGPSILQRDHMRNVLAGIAGVAREYAAHDVADAADFVVVEAEAAEILAAPPGSLLVRLLALPLGLLIPAVSTLGTIAQLAVLLWTDEEMSPEVVLSLELVLGLLEVYAGYWVWQRKASD